MHSPDNQAELPKLGLSTARWLAIAVAVAHVCLAVWFANITPYRSPGIVRYLRDAQVQDIGAPDERQHVNYVRHLLEGKGFPVFHPNDPNLYESYQSHQPPAYYLLAAAWCKVAGIRDPASAETGPRLRYLNALLGGLGVFTVFLLGYWGFKRPEVGLAAATFAAFLPMNVALSGAVSNDVLLFLLCTLVLAFSAKGIQDGWSLRLCLATGVCTGLALLTKTTALGLLPAVLLAVVLSGQGRPHLKGWVAAIVPMLLLPLFWWLRNERLYGDPLAMNAFKQAFTGSAQASTFIQGYGLPGYLINWVGWWTARSFFGAFGYMDIWLNETGLPTGAAPNALYRVLIVLSVIAFLGWLGSWKRYDEGRSRSVQGMNLVFFLVIALLFLSFNMQYFQGQARYLLPAIGPISCGFGLGALTICKGRWLPAVLALAVVFGGTSVYAGIRIPDEFQRRLTA